MSLRLGTVQHQDGGLRLGSVQYSGLTQYAPTTWGGERVEWDSVDVFWFAEDEIAPTLALARILKDGIKLRLSFSKVVRFGNGGNAGWAITASGGAVTASYETGEDTSQLIYALSRTVDSSETVAVAYTQPTDGIEDLIGNDLASLPDFAVTFPVNTGIIRTVIQPATSSVVRGISNG